MEDLTCVRLLMSALLTLELLSLSNGTGPSAEQECPIQIEPNRMVQEYQGKSTTARCEPTSTDAKNLYWEVKGDKVSSKTWSPDTHEDWDPRPACTATFEGIGTCKKILPFILYKIPDSVSIHLVNTYDLADESKEIQLQCDIADVAPAQNLDVLWYQGEERFEPTIKDQLKVTGCLPKNDSDCSIGDTRSRLNVSSTVHVKLNRTHNSAEFRCVARLNLTSVEPNKTSEAVNVTVNYTPAINRTKLPNEMPVFRGYTEDLVCEANGHPPPEIHWFSNSDREFHVTGSTLIISEAGIYNCTATNEMGSDSYVVKVILKEDYLPLIAGFVAATVVIISIVFIFIYSIYYKNTRMRRYNLKNPKLSTQNGNVAHNGWEMQFPMTKLS